MRRRLAPVAEHRHVGVPEAVDRLELVADEEQLLRGAGAQKIDQPRLQLVRVLELVDHDRAKPQLLELPDRLIRLDQLDRAKLQVLEVECRLAVLRLPIGLGEAGQQLLQELAVARRELLECDRVHVLARIAERRRTHAADGRGRQLDQALREARRLKEIEDVGRRVFLRLRGPGIQQQRIDLAAQFGDRVVEALAHGWDECQIEACGAQRVVDADEHLAEPGGLVGGEELPAVGLVGGAERLQGRVEGLALQHPRLRLVEHAEPGIDARCERVRGQEPAAEAVDRRDPGAVEVAREIGPLELEQAGSDPRPQLAGGAVGVGDDEQGVDVEAVDDHGAGEALHEDGRLAGACAGGDERRSARVDRCLLLGVRGGHPSLRTGG